MTITRIGSNAKYASGWELAFGKAAKQSGAARKPAKKAAPSKKKAAPKKKSKK